MRKIILAAALAGAASTPAFAQADAPFTGLRVEGLAGYDNVRPGDADGEDVEGIDGFQYGLAVGYDVQLGGVVVGAEGEISDSTGNSEGTLDFGDGVVDSRLETGRDLYAGLRVGFPVTPTTMIYAKGGYTNTRIESRFDNGTDVFEDRLNVDGFRLGAGAEFLFGPNAYGKLEYRYSNYSSLNYEDDDFNLETGIDLDRHQVVAGVGVRF
ncbi:outer membrane immunogenic protein [Sphingomonas jejuensis]|uniref:Outer membrane immunogenic protein n=1 Tax=Sphingomonas jejuensis TaxID=904715 RepID=A0ABX0XNP9_9SPHN|nr:porin family protein [Sphingomonas jejuensis]NJC35006.1 outer membrane immunogenic protein [Sphingomonas jejuensis]